MLTAKFSDCALMRRRSIYPGVANGTRQFHNYSSLVSNSVITRSIGCTTDFIDYRPHSVQCRRCVTVIFIDTLAQLKPRSSVYFSIILWYLMAVLKYSNVCFVLKNYPGIFTHTHPIIATLNRSKLEESQAAAKRNENIRTGYQWQFDSHFNINQVW